MIGGWVLAGVSLWAVILGWLVTPWLALAGALVFTGLVFYALEAWGDE